MLSSTPAPTAPARPASRRSFRDYEPWLVGAAVALACVALNLARNHGWLHTRHFELGGEYMKIANALSEGRGFSDPFGAGSGPTGWMPPAFAWVLFWVKGIWPSHEGLPSGAFMYALIGLKCLAIGAGAALAWSLAKLWRLPTLFRVTLPFAWLLLVVWAQWDHVTASMHDGWWVALVAMLCLHGVARVGRSRINPTLIAGLGLAALSSPVIFAATIGALGVRAGTLAYRRKRISAFWRRGLRPALPAMLVGFVCAGAWIVRVHSATGIWAPLKTNAGFELWQSLERTTDGVPTFSTFAFHPVNHAPLRDEYVALGEKAFVRKHADAARKIIAENPARFLAQIRERAFNALIWMERRRDNLHLSGELPEPVRDELLAAHLILPRKAKDDWAFLFLDGSDRQRADTLARLSPASGDFMRTAWSYHDNDLASEAWWVRLGLRELALSGLVTLAGVVALACCDVKTRRRLRMALIFYAAILGPYILVSHYYRYQDGLLHIQVFIVAVAAGGLLRRIRAKPDARLASP